MAAVKPAFGHEGIRSTRPRPQSIDQQGPRRLRVLGVGFKRRLELGKRGTAAGLDDCCTNGQANADGSTRRFSPSISSTPARLLRPRSTSSRSVISAPDTALPTKPCVNNRVQTLVPAPRSFFMDVKCPGCFTITTVFSHAQTVVICAGCSTVLCQPTGGKARLTEGCSFRRK